jgi:hypothetical protein
MTDSLLVIGAVAFIVFIVALNLLAATLRVRFASWIFGRVRRSVSRAAGLEPLPGTPEEPARDGLGAMFDVMEGRRPAEKAEPRGPKDRDRE